MANATDPFAQTIHGTNPQFLVEKITRLKIYNSAYWKEECFGLTAETIIDKAVALKYIGGTYGGNNKPSKFLCLVLKMLQLQPEKEIVIELILNEDFKYVRALGVMYMRLIGKTEDIYKYLEPLYNDFRKLAYRGMSGWSIMHMDEFIDALLRDELVCDIALPHIVKRMKLEELGTMQERQSALDLDMLDVEESDDEPEAPVIEATSQAVPAVANASASSTAAAVIFDDDDDDDEEPVPTTRSAPVAASATVTVPEVPPKSITTSSNAGPVPKLDGRFEEDKTRKLPNIKDKDGSDRDDDERRGHRRGDSRGRDDKSRSRRSSSRDGGRFDRHDRDRDDRRSSDRRRGRDDSRDRRNSPDRRRRDRSDSREDRRGGGSRRRDDSRDRRESRYRSDSEDSRRGGAGGSSRRHSKGGSTYHSDEDEDDRRDHKRHRRNDSPHYEESDNRKGASSSSSSSSVAAAPASVAAAPPAKNNSKLFDKMFGKKKTSNSGAGKVIVNTKGEKVEITAPEGTVEYWNLIRESLGMSKLK